MAKENAPLSRKEEEEKKAAEAQQQSGYTPGKLNATYNRMMNKLSPLKGGSMFKKKPNVSQPGDASEVQADAVAKAVTEGNANAAQVELQNTVSGEGITAKASDVTIETPPGFDEQIEKMKGGGLPLPDDKKSNLEEMLDTELDHVRLHTGSDAAELSDQINALAFATGDDIFYPGDLNDEELLAHEVAHVVQGVGDVNPKIHRFEAPGHEAAERVGLTKNNMFSNNEVSMIYMGNWMRDMNQIFVPAMLNIFSQDTTLGLVVYSGYKKFGRVFTSEQFGYYIPAEHIDNPAGQLPDYDYLSAPPTAKFSVEGVKDRFKTSLFPPRNNNQTTPQASNDPKQGKYKTANIYNVTADSNISIYILRTKEHIETRLNIAADRGRNPDGMLHFGAALHAVEDLFAHSNFVEIALNMLLQEKNEKEFLPQLKKEKGERVVQTLAPSVNGSPALVTGTFTANDTLISVGSEVVKMMREGLGPPATKEEEKIQDAFVLQMLASFDEQLKNDKDMRERTANTLQNAGAPANLVEGVRNGTTSLHDSYATLLVWQEKLNSTAAKVLTLLSPLIPIEELKKEIADLKALFRRRISEELDKLANQIDAYMLETKVKDTTLTNAAKEHEAVIAAKGGKQSKVAEMSNKIFDTKLPSPAENLKSAQEHKKMIDALPEGTKTGPSHSQLAKDHEDSIFHGLAFLLASEADNKIGEKMTSAWGNKPQFADPATSLLSKEDKTLDQDQKEQKLMHKKRTENDKKSLEWGKKIITLGHSDHVEYDLKKTRKISAYNIREVANNLKVILDSPGNVYLALGALKKKLNKGDSDTNFKPVHNLVDSVIEAAKTGAKKLDNVAQKSDLKKVIDNLNNAALKVESAETLQQRESAYNDLESTKNMFVSWIGSVTSDPKSAYNNANMILFYSFCLTLLNREIAVVAPAYTTEQVNSLKKAKVVTEDVKMGDISNKPKPTQDLLQTARNYVSHPKENDWWKKIIMKYAQDFGESLANEIKARNGGYSKLREK
jgi:hypothetical protein